MKRPWWQARMGWAGGDRRWLAAGLVALGLGGALLLAGLPGSPLLLAGGLLLVLHAATRLRPAAPRRPDAPSLFERDSTQFASRFADTRQPEDAAAAPHPRPPR